MDCGLYNELITILEIPTRAFHHPSTRRSSRGLRLGGRLRCSECSRRCRPERPKRAVRARTRLPRYRVEEPCQIVEVRERIYCCLFRVQQPSTTTGAGSRKEDSGIQSSDRDPGTVRFHGFTCSPSCWNSKTDSPAEDFHLLSLFRSLGSLPLSNFLRALSSPEYRWGMTLTCLRLTAARQQRAISAFAGGATSESYKVGGDT